MGPVFLGSTQKDTKHNNTQDTNRNSVNNDNLIAVNHYRHQKLFFYSTSNYSYYYSEKKLHSWELQSLLPSYSP